MQNSAAHSVRSPPPCGGRAIACGQFSANGRNIGIEIGSCAQLWNPAALSHARFESKISTCDSPAHKGEGNTEIAARTDSTHSERALSQGANLKTTRYFEEQVLRKRRP